MAQVSRSRTKGSECIHPFINPDGTLTFNKLRITNALAYTKQLMLIDFLQFETISNNKLLVSRAMRLASY